MDDGTMGQAKAVMTPEQALKILNDSTADVQSDRRGHDLIKKALSVVGLSVQQWRAMQDPHPPVEQPADGPLDAPGGPEDPDKLLTEDGG